MLPTGTAQLVVALHDAPFRWTASDGSADTWRGAVLHGPQSRYYVAHAKASGTVVGASLRPSAAALFGVSATSLTDRHVPLEALWGAHAERMRQQISAATTPQAALDELERSLAAQLQRPLLLHPATAGALFGDWNAERPFRLREYARESGFSEKHVIGCFSESVGLTPARYFRIRRFAGILRALGPARSTSIAEVAADAGYADHAHLVRDFREFAGVAPSAYRPADGTSLHHHRAS